MFKFSGKRPTNLGARDGKLTPCPSSPNCVCSQASDAHAIAPLEFSGDAEAALRKLRGVIESMPRTQIVEAKPGYLYAEFTSSFMGFVDDVEFFVGGSVIHVRSASRLGYSDLGVNRKRVEAIRETFARAS
jgi:uncharacterized protein (DUF1499 family)